MTYRAEQKSATTGLVQGDTEKNKYRYIHRAHASPTVCFSRILLRIRSETWHGDWDVCREQGLRVKRGQG